MAPLCVPNLCRAVLRVPLRGAISQELPPLTYFLSTCFFVVSYPLCVTVRYTDLTASSLSAFLSSIAYPPAIEWSLPSTVSENYRNNTWKEDRIRRSYVRGTSMCLLNGKTTCD